MPDNNFFEYEQRCPECIKEGLDHPLGFEMGTGKIRCGKENPHEFATMPGENPVSEEVTPGTESAHFDEPAGDEDKAASDARLSEIMHREPAIQLQPSSDSDESWQASEALLQSGPKDEPEPIYKEPADIVPIDQVRTVDGGLMIAIKIPEVWVSALQAEAENREPKITLTEYVQELVDQGLLEMYTALPVAR